MRKIIIGFLSVFLISLSSFVHGEHLTYPVGIYDVQALSGIDFNINAVRDVAMLIYSGDQDDNDQVPYDDGYDQRERDLVNRLFGTTPMERWPHAESIYSYMGLNSTFILYPGVGHEFTNESIQNEIDFFKNNMNFRNQQALNYNIIKVIPEDSDRNFSWPYYLLIPSNPQPLQTVLLVEPNNTGTNHDDWSVHDRSAFDQINNWSFFAQELNTPYLVPTFPRPRADWEVYTHALDRDSLTTDIEGLVCVDLQLIEMIEDARERLSIGYNITIEDKVFMRGFSASGTFTNRFAMLHPERVKAVASGAPGGWPILPVSHWPPRWDAVILSRTSPDHTITSGSDIQVYGTTVSNQITLESGAKAELINFPGQNSIQIQTISDLFTVSRSGTIVSFQGTDGTLLKIPATTDVQTIDFTDREPMTLIIHDNKVMLDDQVITTTAASIAGTSFHIEKHYMTLGPVTGCEDPSPVPKDVFEIGDNVVAYNYIRNMKEGDTSHMIWYAPDGTNFTIENRPTVADGSFCCYTGTNPGIAGNWTVEFYFNDVKQYTESFAIKDDSPYSDCGAYVAPNVWKEFDCYNLAAIGKETGADPFSPSWELNGGYWQWGRKGPDPDQEDWYNTNTMHFAHGPTGPGETEANSGSLSGWDSSYAPDGAWSDSHKTSNDPCPVGFRVPTKSQWHGVSDNNTQSIVGTWSDSTTNYNSARFFGNNLMLQAAGSHNRDNGAMSPRGSSGFYWSSSGGGGAWYLYFSRSEVTSYDGYRQHGFSIRCVAEDSSQPQGLSLDKTTLSLDSGDSETVSISGGTGYYSASSSNTQVATPGN